jgi:hypothetical protein
VKNSGAPTRINAWNSHLSLGYTQRGELIAAAADITVYPDITNKLGSVTLPDFDSINQRVRNDWLIASNSSIPYYSTTNDNGIIHIRMGSEVVGQIAFPMGKPVNLMLGSNGNLLFQNYEGRVFCWTPTPSNFKRFGNDDLVHEYGLFRRFRQEGKKLLIEDAKSRSIVFSLDLQVPEGRRPVAATSENGRYLAVSEDSQSVHIYDSENGAKKHHFELNVESDEKQIYQMAVSNDASKIAVAWPSSINVISSKSNEILGTIKFPLSFSKHFYVDSLTFSPQDAFLIVQTENSINLFDTSNCSLRHSIPFHQSGCYPEGTSCSWFALSNDEKFVALTNKNTGLVYIWNLDGTRHLVDVIETGTKSRELAVGAAFTSDNHYFVWNSGNSGRIHCYDLRKNRTLPDFLMDEGIENLLISKTNQLLIKGLQENYATDWNNLIYLMTASPSDINSNVATKTGFRIASSETALYSQERLEQLLSNSRPTNQLLAVDRTGSDIQSFEMFGPTQVRRIPIRPIQSLPSKNNGRATTAVLTTPKAPNQKPTESKGMVCPTGFAMPVFNPFPIAFDKGDTPLCSDLPLLDVAEATDYPRFTKSMDQYVSTRRFPGAKQLVALLYMDNGGYSRPVSYVAKNVKISTAIERIGNVYKLTATYTGDNVAPASASVSIEVAPDERLEIIPNSGSMYNYVGQLILDRQRLDLGNSTFVLGDLDPDWQYSLFFSYNIAITRR